MRCRTNLKKEKRLRNRINAFRFKKGGFGPRRRFTPVDHAAIQKKADEDNQFYAMVRCASTHRACPLYARSPHSAYRVLGVLAGVHLHRRGGGGRIGGGEEEPAQEGGGGGAGVELMWHRPYWFLPESVGGGSGPSVYNGVAHAPCGGLGAPRTTCGNIADVSYPGCPRPENS